MSRDYPRAKYHASYPPALVKSEEEEDALGWEWVDHPNEAPVRPEPRDETNQEEKERESLELAEEKEEDIQPKEKRGPGRPKKEA